MQTSRWLKVSFQVVINKIRGERCLHRGHMNGKPGTVCVAKSAAVRRPCVPSRDTFYRASLVVQWLRIHLPVHGTQAPSLVGEDPPATEQLNPCPMTAEPVCLDPLFCKERRHCRKNPTHRKWKIAPTHCNVREPTCSSEDPVQPKLTKTHTSYNLGNKWKLSKAILLGPEQRNPLRWGKQGRYELM